MLPIPTSTARLAFLGASAALVLGTASASLPALGVGAGILLALAAAFVLSTPMGRRVRRQKLELAWWLAHGEPGVDSGAALPNKPFEVRCFLRHRGDEDLVLVDLVPIVLGGTRLLDGDGALRVRRASRTDFSFRLVAPAVGRVVLHGLAVRLAGPLGLFEVPLYFPNPLVIKVLPRAAASLRGRARMPAGVAVDRAGRSRLAAGGGTEMRELRELQPGDSLRSIAWRPSARRAKLLVREVEQEVQETRYVVLDVSGTMRAGEPGQRKLDFALEVVAAEARRALAEGDRFGLVTVDGRLLAHVAPSEGNVQLLRVLDALVSATEIVDEDLTDVDDEDVVAIVGRYLRQQDGIDFRATGGGWNLGLLVQHVARSLAEASERGVDTSMSGSSEPRGRTPAGKLLRRFCRSRGIPLPHRPDPRDGAKAPSLGSVVRSVAAASRAPMTIAIITDLDGLGDPHPLVDAVALARRRGHAVAVAALDATRFHPRPTDALGAALWDVYARGEARRIAELSASLSPLGVRVVPMGPDDAGGWALSRAIEAARRRAA